MRMIFLVRKSSCNQTLLAFSATFVPCDFARRSYRSRGTFSLAYLVTMICRRIHRVPWHVTMHAWINSGRCCTPTSSRLHGDLHLYRDPERCRCTRWHWRLRFLSTLSQVIKVEDLIAKVRRLFKRFKKCQKSRSYRILCTSLCTNTKVKTF